MTRDKNRDRDKSMDKSMDKIRYVPVPRGTNIEMSLVPERFLRGTKRGTNRLNNRNVPVPAEGQNEGQNLSSFGERDLGKCP